MYVLVWRPRKGTALPALGLFLLLSLLAAGREMEPPLRLAVPETLLPAAKELVTAYTSACPGAQVHLLPVDGEAAATGLVREKAAEAALVRGAFPASGGDSAPRPVRLGGGRLRLVHVGWEAVAAVSGPFTPPGDLSAAQVTALLSGKPVPWGTIAPGASGRVRLYWPAGNAALPLLADFLAARGQRLQPGRVVRGFDDFRQALLADPAGLGFVPLSALAPGLRPLAVGGALPDRDALAAGRYPLSRPLFLALPGRPTAPARALVREARRRWGEAGGRPVTVALAGDFLPDGPVGEAIRKHGPEWPWAKVGPLTAGCDLAVCNLEAPLSEIGWKINEYRGDPVAVRGLRSAGIDGVTVANDHILDYDDPALLSTLALLDREGIAHAGAGATLAHARRPAVFQVRGIRVALLAYGRPELGRSRTGRRWDASPWSPGIAPAVTEEVAEDVRRARREAEVVLVGVHWGEEGAEAPRSEDRLLARAAIDAGAAAVFGCGPGLVQGLELYQDGVVLYGLGSFVRQEDEPAKQLGVVAVLSLAGGWVQGVKLVPVRNVGAQPVVLEGTERAAALRLLHERTRHIQAVFLQSPAGNGGEAPYSGGRRGPSLERHNHHGMPDFP
ncbi:MAG: CapA family protein [Bacillota bacterium]|nr:CapA family protein [Bacillota bacterium]